MLFTPFLLDPKSDVLGRQGQDDWVLKRTRNILHQHNILRRNTINDNVKDRHYAFFYIIFLPHSLRPCMAKAVLLPCNYTAFTF